MSRVYFADSQNEVELRGSERAYLNIMLTNQALAILGPDEYGARERLTPVLKHPEYFRNDLVYWGMDFRTTFLVGMKGPMFHFEGHDIDQFQVMLNTASALESPYLAIAAWIHGQSEVHGFVEGEHRVWMANLMQRGLDKGVFRQNQGWEGVIAFLEQSINEPAVMSYSVCDTFPDQVHEEILQPYVQEGDEGIWDAYERWRENTPAEQQWEQGLLWLRENQHAISPENITTRLFDHQVTPFDLLDTDRLRSVLDTAQPSTVT